MPDWLVATLLTAVLLLLALVLAGLAASRDARDRVAFARLRRLRNRQRLRVARALASDPRLPRRVRAIPLVLVAYLVFPFDIVPDFIPVLGQLDDLVVIALALWLLLRLTPPSLLDEHLLREEEAA